MPPLTDQLTSPATSILGPIVKMMALDDGKIMFIIQPPPVIVAAATIVQHVNIDVLRVDLDRVAVLEEPPIAATAVHMRTSTATTDSRAILEMIRMMMEVVVMMVMKTVGMMISGGRGGAKILVVVNININNNDIVQMLINTVTIGTDNAMVMVSWSGSCSSTPAAYSTQDAARDGRRGNDLRMAQLQGTTTGSKEPLGSGAHSGRLSLVDLYFGIFWVWFGGLSG